MILDPAIESQDDRQLILVNRLAAFTWSNDDDNNTYELFLQAQYVF
jgi:hypothetical protein